MLIGSHLSTAGGLHNALISASKYKFKTVAMFVRNQRRWSIPPLLDEDINKFHEIHRSTGINPIVGHGSYLVNLAGNEEIRSKSLVALQADIDRAQILGLDSFVIHVGSNPDLEKGLDLIISGLNRINNCEVKILLETTAGQGNCIGHRFEHLASILAGVDEPGNFGVCLDTAHIFAAGYDIRTKAAWKKTMAEFDSMIGIDNLHAIHCNDSLKPLGSCRDRHAHIGQGEIGIEGFRAIVNGRRIQNVPLILETPKGITEDGQDWDVINSSLLQELRV